MNEALDLIAVSMRPAITESLWTFDSEVLSAQVEGITRSPFIAYAEVRDRGRILASSGNPAGVLGSDAPSRLVTIERESLGKKIHLGELLVIGDRNGLRRDFLESFLAEIVFLGAAIIFVLALVYVLVDRMITRHLAQAASHFGQVADPGAVERLNLERASCDDELETLAASYNGLLDRLGSSYMLANAAREEAEAKGLSLSRTLQEKDVLVKEVLHRTRNNLQTMLSIVYLQRRWDSRQSREALFDAIELRIHAMATVQGFLHGLADLSTLRLDECLRELCKLIFERRKPNSCAVSLEFDLAPLETNLDTAMAAGLAFTELASNAAVHGCHERADMWVRVTLKTGPSGLVVMEVLDDGAAAVEAIPASGIGLRIARFLVEEQLGGSLEAGPSSEGGWSARALFPVQP